MELCGFCKHLLPVFSVCFPVDFHDRKSIFSCEKLVLLFAVGHWTNKGLSLSY